MLSAHSEYWVSARTRASPVEAVSLGVVGYSAPVMGIAETLGHVTFWLLGVFVATFWLWFVWSGARNIASDLWHFVRRQD